MELLWCMIKTGFHNLFCPMIIINICTTTNLKNWFLRIIISYICLILAIQIRIIIRCHIPTASPVFISHSKDINLPGFLMSILFSKVSHWRYSVKCHIFNPFRHFLNSSATNITIDIRFTSKLTNKFKILMCSKAIIFHNTAPVCVDHFFTICFLTDAIFPMVFIRKTSSRPAK